MIHFLHPVCQLDRAWLLALFLLPFFAWGCVTEGNDPNLVAAQQLITKAKAAYKVGDTYALHPVMPEGNKSTVTKWAKEAEQMLLAYQASIPSEGLAAAECLLQLAWAAHLQGTEFSYHQGVSPEAQRAQEYLTKALVQWEEAAKSNPVLVPVARLAGVYEQAATITTPHMYYGYLSPSTKKAQETSEGYLQNAIGYHMAAHDTLSALRLLRHLPPTRDNLAQAVEWGLGLQPRQDMDLAFDIQRLLHALAYEASPTAALPQALSDWVAIADTAFTRPGADKSGLEAAFFLQSDMAYVCKFRGADLEGCLRHARRALDIARDLPADCHRVSFLLAATLMERGDLAAAATIYRGMEAVEDCSPIDREAASWGLAMTWVLQGDEGQAAMQWRNNLQDHPIMNGISSYAALFSTAFRPKLRTEALAFLSHVSAVHAIRIVQESW